MNHEECLFCKIISGALPSDQLYSDEHVVVFRDIYPKAPVHLLIVPKEHIISLCELESRHDALMAHILRLLPKIAQEQGLIEGFRTVINTGKGGGQVIFHLHVHLMGGGHLGTEGFD